MRLNIKSEKDWFAASGEVQIDEDKVMDLRALLDLMQNNKSRFVAVGQQQVIRGNARLARIQQFTVGNFACGRCHVGIGTEDAG